MTSYPSTNVPTFTFHNYKVYVNTACIKSLPDFDYVQIMVHSQKKSPKNSVQNFLCQGNGAYELEPGQPL